MGAVEQLEKNKIKLTITVTPERFREGLQLAYNKNKGHFNIPGFRKGKAPRKVIEQAYGKDIFYDEAINHVLPDAYEQACNENEIEPVYKPEISLGEINDADGATFYVTVYVKPSLEIDGYYGLTYPKMDTAATEADIQAALQAEREKNARHVTVDRPAELGDVVTINFTGYMDGVPFEGGHAENMELTLGSKMFIDTFEDQLVGHIPGDDVTVNVTFPEGYSQNNELSGKPATFEVEILDVQRIEYPEIDDEFAQDVSEFDTLEEFRGDIAKRIVEKNESNLETDKRLYIIKQLSQKADLTLVPETMYLARLDEMMADFTHHIESKGMQIDNYMRFAQLTEASLKANWRAQAELDVNGQLVLEAVARKENIIVDDEAYRIHVAELTKFEGEQLDKFIDSISPNRKSEIEKSLQAQKALDFVLEKAIAVDPEELLPLQNLPPAAGSENPVSEHGNLE